MSTIKLFDGDLGSEIMYVRCNLAQASAPIEVDYRAEGESKWEDTQFQCADARHTTNGLIEIGKRLAAHAVEMAEDDFGCECEEVPCLQPSADSSHEDARAWYSSYGWHISTENAGDVTHEAVEYDWLDDSDDGVIADKLCEADEDLARDEAESVVAKAREVREAGEAVEAALDEAVEAYQAGDCEGVMAALREAKTIESEHGDCPAARALAAELFGDATVID